VIKSVLKLSGKDRKIWGKLKGWGLVIGDWIIGDWRLHGVGLGFVPFAHSNIVVILVPKFRRKDPY
jgi:hypothetical protein